MKSIIGMTLRKVNAKIIVTNLIVAQKAGLKLTLVQLETHYLAGGRIPDIVRAMIILDSAGINPGWETLTKEDLQGIDILEEARQVAERFREESNNNSNKEYVEVDETSEIE